MFSKSYIIVYSFFVYFMPLFMIIYSYYFIIAAVSAHEKSMREQAKKMNVASLRSAENQSASAEHKLAKVRIMKIIFLVYRSFFNNYMYKKLQVALMTISLWFMAWTPYLVINYAGMFQTVRLTPLFTIWGAVFAKANAVYNPIVYGIR